MHSSSQCCPHQCTYHLFGLGDLKDVADVDSGVDWNWPWPWQIVHPRAVALKYIVFVCFFVSSRTPQTWRTFDVRIQSLQLRDREEEDQTPAWFLSNWLTFVFPLLQPNVFVKRIQLNFYPPTSHIYLEHVLMWCFKYFWCSGLNVGIVIVGIVIVGILNVGILKTLPTWLLVLLHHTLYKHIVQPLVLIFSHAFSHVCTLSIKYLQLLSQDGVQSNSRATN